MIFPVVIFLDNDGVIFAVQAVQVLEDSRFFFKTCVTSAVKTKAHDPVRLQKFQPGFDGFYSGFRFGGQAVVSAGKIAAVEQDGVC